MAHQEHIPQFPDLADKVNNAVRPKSQRDRYEEQREAKRKRDDEETAAALKDFTRHFGADDSYDHPLPPPSNSKRQFAASARSRTTGPGSLDPPRRGPGSLGPASKDYPRHSDRQKPRHFSSARSLHSHQGADFDQDPEDQAPTNAAKPVLEITCLPPQYTKEDVEKFLESSKLEYEPFTLINPRDAPNVDREDDRYSFSVNLIIKLSVPYRHVEDFVKQHNDTYIGFGYRVHVVATTTVNMSKYPTHSSMAVPLFNMEFPRNRPANRRQSSPPNRSHRGRPGPSHAQDNDPDSWHTKPFVRVKTPKNLKDLKLINRVAEEAVKDRGEQFEAGLMTLEYVQKTEHWEWLWNRRCDLGVYYLWRYYEIMSGYIHTMARYERNKSEEARMHQLFAPPYPEFREPDPFPFEFCMSVADLADDPAYESSDLDEEPGERKLKHWEKSADRGDWLNPYETAKIVWLLKRMPNSLAKCTRGDAMAVTDFALDHVHHGADKVVELLTSNCMRPFNCRPVNENGELTCETSAEEEVMVSDEPVTPELEAARAVLWRAKPKPNPTEVKESQLIGLYLVNDILFNCVETETPGGWRYRREFEKEILRTWLFTHLRRVPKNLKLGRITTERWNSSVKQILDQWDEKNVLEASALREMKKQFETEPKRPEPEQQPELMKIAAGFTPVAARAGPAA